MVQTKLETFNNPESEGESEINLYDIWAVLIKRKWIIVGIFLLSILLSVMYILSIKPVYESRVMIRIGQFRSSEKTTYLEEPIFLSRTLYKEYVIGGKNNEGGKWAFLYSSDLVYNTTDSLLLIAHGSSNYEAQRFLNKIIDTLLKRHSQLYKNAVLLQREKLSFLQKQINSFETQIDSLDKESKNSRRDLASSLMILDEKIKLMDLKQIVDSKLLMTEFLTWPTQVIEGPSLVTEPVEPKMKLYLGLAGIFGLIMGCFGAFIFELVFRFKEIENKKANI